MHYIINARNQIIAADEEFLDLLSIDDLTQIYQSLSNDELNIEFGSNNTLNIKTSLLEETFSINKIQLHSLVGDMYLIELKEIKKADIKVDIEESVIPIGVENISESEDAQKVQEDEENDKNEDNKQENIEITDDIFTQDLELDIKSTEEESNDNIEISDDELFDLLLDSDTSESELISDIHDEVIMDNEEKDTEESPLDETIVSEDNKAEEQISDITPIVLDISSLSETIGISEDDYKTFLNEYISTAMSLKNDILSKDTEKRSGAISTLTHLSNVLHIPNISDILDKIDNSTLETQGVFVDELYLTISRLSMNNELENVKDDSVVIQDKNDNVVREVNTVDTQELYQSSISSEHKIDLSDVKPIHFDFSMEEAANELSLPVDLIEEFVNDFIEQAHEETEKMLTAYDEGDLDKVNKIGHLLKGTSSNLRIVPLADTLYKIQFCESLDDLEPLVKDYWGHFLAFENHIKLRTK